MKRSFHVLSLGVCLLALICALGVASAVRAEVLFEDRFDDGDRDNDGLTDPDGTPVATPDGIKWLGIDGVTSVGRQRPGLAVANDDEDTWDETNVQSGIGSGNALRIGAPTLTGSDGLGAEFVGMFPQPVTLGTTIGSQLIVSYDIRIRKPTADATLPEAMNWRFGIFQDTDSQLGQPWYNNDYVPGNPFTNPPTPPTPNTPTVWGETDGLFDGRAVSVNGAPSQIGPGAMNDYGVVARIHGGTRTANLNDYRIYDELNVNQPLGGTGDNYYVARPGDGPDLPPDDDIPAREAHWNAAAASMNKLGDFLPHHITLTISRVEPNPNGNGSDRWIEVDVDGTSFAGYSTINETLSGLTDRDTFHYFIGAWSTAAPLHYLLDNFKVESIVGVGLLGDFDDDGKVDGRDFLVWQRGETTPALDPDLLADWQAHYGESSSPFGALTVAVPEPSALCLVLSAVFIAVGTRRTR